MLRKCFACFGLACLSLGGGLYSEEEKAFFSDQSIYHSIEKMLEYHVEYKEFSPLLIKRSFKLFLDQFDPYKIYLLQSEAHQFLHMSQEALEQVAEGHRKASYAKYEELNQLAQNAIVRAREIRKALRLKLLTCDISSGEEEIESFPKTLEDLQKKTYSKLFQFLVSEKRWEGVEDFSQEQREILLDLWEERLSRIEKSYMSSRFEPDFSRHVLKACAKGLDAHSSFFSAEEARDLRTTLEKQFEGIGVILREGVRGIMIKGLVKGSPAEKSGKLQKGDLLLAVNGETTSALSYEEVLQKLKGERGEKVVLKLCRLQEGQKEDFEVSIVREKVIMEEDRVQFSEIPFGSGVIGKIEIPSFYESEDGASCVDDLREAISSLKKNKNLLGILVDMRENSGGFLSQAVKVASLFMSGGVVVVSKYAEGQMQYLRNTDGRVFYQGPMVLLTSKASASATEIVAQALQDYGIAVVVGDRRTYGKGTIQYQTVTDKNSSSYFKVTVGKYYTASGRSTQIEGVHADIEIPTAYAPFNIGEKYLAYPLKNDQIEPVFIDPLTDVAPRTRAWMKKKYLPRLQKKLSFWTEVLPVLRSNSEFRIHHDQEFLRFLGKMKEESEALDLGEAILEPSDPTFQEAVNVLKDMIFLDMSQKKIQNHRK